MSDSTRVAALIKELRTGHGLSQSRLADLLCGQAGRVTLTREDISRWESGRRRPGAFWLRHLAVVLDVPLGLLEAADVDRRSFLSSVAGAAIAPLVAADLIEHGFAAALGEHAAPTLDQWIERTDAYGRDYMSLGAADIQRRLAADMVLLQQQLDTAPTWMVAAKLMTLFGKTIPGVDGSKAIQWYRRAAVAADRSGDDELRVWVRGRAAIALGYEGAALPVARRFAEEARAISDKPSLGLLNATMGGAHAAALLGDRGRARALLAEGRRLHDAAGSYEQTSDYAVPAWRMQVFVSLLAARLGDEGAALTAQDEASRTLPASLPRFRTHLELHRGLMMARAGDRAGGLAYARSAMGQLPPEKHSLTLRLLVAEIESGR